MKYYRSVLFSDTSFGAMWQEIYFYFLPEPPLGNETVADQISAEPPLGN